MAPSPETSRPAAEPHTDDLVTDPVALRAAAHPMRLKLIGMVGIDGTLTASQAAQKLGSTPAVTAYHLRTLAKYGFVEDAGAGSGRERPWKLTARGASFSWSGQDPVGRVLTRVAHAEWLEHVQYYQQHMDEYPQEVRDVSAATEAVLHATPAEVAELSARIDDLLAPFRARLDLARRPPGTVAMEVLVFTHPLPPEFHPSEPAS